MSRFEIAFSSLIAFGFLAPDSLAQNLWGVNRTTSLTLGGAAATGPCLYPDSNILFDYTVGPPLCPGAPLLFPGIAADVAIDRSTDTVWVTDGVTITNFTKAGAPLRTLPVPLGFGPVTGLGWGMFFGISVLWITNGVGAAAIVTPLALGCSFPVFIIPPFPLPVVLGATDIDFDPVSGTLFLSDLAGVVVNCFIGGALGPAGIFAPAAVCPIAPIPLPLLGIAVEVTAPATLIVTDGTGIERILVGGAPAPPAFWLAAACALWTTPGVTGLGFDAAAVDFGFPCNPPLSPVPLAPLARAVGQSVAPNPGFALTLDASPGSAAILILGAGAACPPLAIGACGLVVAPVTFVFGPIVMPAAGTIGIPAAIPPLVPLYASIYLQWLVQLPGGVVQATQGVEFTTAPL